MTRVSLATRVQQGEFDPVVGALAIRMANNPAEACGVVTGAHTWPPPDGECAEELATQAADKADELIELRNCGYRVSRLSIDELHAAELALLEIARDEADEQRVADDAYENRRFVGSYMGRL